MFVSTYVEIVLFIINVELSRIDSAR